MYIKVATRKINAFIEVWELEQADREIQMIVYKEDIEALRVAKEALEKQIPKLAQETQELIEIEYICPECDHINGQRFNYCWNCGQSITHS